MAKPPAIPPSPDEHLGYIQAVRPDAVERLKGMLAATVPELTEKGQKQGVWPMLLALDPMLYAYFEGEAARRNKLRSSGRGLAKASAHSLLIEALRFRLEDVELYRHSSALVAARRSTLGMVPVTVRTPVDLHQDLELLAMELPRPSGTRAMSSKAVAEALAFIWAATVNIENLLKIPSAVPKEHASHPPRSVARDSRPSVGTGSRSRN